MLVTTILVLLALGGVAARCQYTPDANGHVVVPRVVPDGVTSPPSATKRSTQM